MTRILGQLLLAAAIAIAAILVYQRVVDPRRSEETGRLKGLLAERTRDLGVAELARDRSARRLDSALSAVDSPIVRWRTLRQIDTLRIPATSTPSDTAAALRDELAETRSTGDSVVRACSDLRSSCTAYRDTATATIAAWSARYSTLDSLHRSPKPGKRWNVSLAFGYGFGMRGDTLVRSPVIGLTVGRSLVRW